METVIITGTNRGIGKKLTNYLLDEGYKVIGLNRSLDKNDNKNFKSYHYDANYAGEMELLKLVKNIASENNLDNFILLLNAAIFYSKPILELNKNELLELFTVNAIAPFLLLKHFLPELTKNNGKVISIGSKAEDFLMDNSEVYSITKEASRKLLTSQNKVLTIHLKFPRLDNNNFKDLDFFEAIKNAINSKTSYIINF